MKLVNQEKKIAYVICQKGANGSKFIDANGGIQNECLESCFIYDQSTAMSRLNKMSKSGKYGGQLTIEQYEIV